MYQAFVNALYTFLRLKPIKADNPKPKSKTLPGSGIGVRVIWEATKFQVPIDKPFDSHIKIKDLADLWFRGRATASSSQCDVWLDYYLLDEDAAGA